MKKINNHEEEELFINLLDKEILRHLKDYCQNQKSKSYNNVTSSYQQTRSNLISRDVKRNDFRIFHKTSQNQQRRQITDYCQHTINISKSPNIEQQLESNVIVKDHKRIVYKTFHKSSKSENLEQFNDIPLSERQSRRINIAQKSFRYTAKAATQQTQRSEFKSFNDEIVVPQRIEDVQSRLQTCKDYLEKEQKRLELIEDQVQKNEFILKELQQELEIVKSNNLIFQKIKNIDQQMYKYQLNSNNHRRVAEELLQFLLSFQQKYTKNEQVNIFVEDFKNELMNMLSDFMQ